MATTTLRVSSTDAGREGLRHARSPPRFEGEIAVAVSAEISGKN